MEKTINEDQPKVQSEMNTNKLIKIIIIGDNKVGKTTLMQDLLNQEITNSSSNTQVFTKQIEYKGKFYDVLLVCSSI